MARTNSPKPNSTTCWRICGNFTAYDARTGKILWNFQTGASIFAAPVTVMVGNKQLVLIGSGTTLFAFGLPGN